jgi:hypothetical protein
MKRRPSFISAMVVRGSGALSVFAIGQNAPTLGTKVVNDNALADFNEAVRFNPNDALAFQNRARLWATCPDATYRDAPRAVESAWVLQGRQILVGVAPGRGYWLSHGKRSGAEPLLFQATSRLVNRSRVLAELMPAL